MDSLHIVVLAQVRGLTFDVVVHTGTLLAVVLYFRHELGRMFVQWFASLRGEFTPGTRLASAALPAFI